MSERDKKAYDLAADTVKQILGLSTAIVALTATLLKDVVPARLPISWVVIMIAWSLLLVSIGYGIQTLRWLTTKMYGPDDVRLPSIADEDITKSASRHIRAFVAALVLLALFGAIEVGGAAFGIGKPLRKDKPDCCCCAGKAK